MKIKSSELIEKIQTLRSKPVVISGYPRVDGADIEIYPELDPSFYYRLKKECVIDVLSTSDTNHSFVELLVDSVCEIECVSRKNASDLDLHCSENHCECTPSDDYGIAFSKKDEARKYVIKIANLLASMGIDELNCRRTGPNSVSVSCCRAMNRLLGALGTASEFDAANEVLATCSGVG